MSGGWLGDTESTMCEMGGGPLVDYGLYKGVYSTGRARAIAVKLALQLASGTGVTFVCTSKVEGERMGANIEALLRWAGCFPVKKYMKKFKVQEVKKL